MRFRFLHTFLIAALFALTSQAAFAAGVTLAWDANAEADIAGYRVHYGEQPGAYTVEVDAHLATTFQINALVEGKTYYFVVEAYTTGGLSSPFSSEVSARIDASTLAGRSQFITLAGADGHLASPTLRWSPVVDAQAYYLYVGTAAGLKDVINTGETQSTSYTLPAMAYEQTFVARIYTKQAGQWRWAEMPFKPATQAPIPLAPAVFTVAAGADGHLADRVLRWSTVADAQAYYLYVGTSPGAKDLVNSGEMAATSYTLAALPSTQTVYARIYTKQAGAWRHTAMSFKPAVQVSPARFITPTSGQQNVTSAQLFTWAKVAQAQAYYLYVGTTAGAKDLINTGEIARTSHVATSLPAGVHLFARLFTKLAGVWYSTAIEFDTAPHAVFLYPTTGASDVSASEKFAWTRVTDAQAYRLTVGTTAGAADILDTGNTNAASHVVSGLEPGRTLHAAIQTFVKGVWEVDAVTFTTSVSARFTQPTAGDGSDLGHGLAWTTILGAEAYKVHLGTTAGGTDLMDGVESAGTTIETPALPAGQPVFAEVWTKYQGEWTKRDTTLTLVGAALSSPSANAWEGMTVSALGQLFTWTTITNAESYYLGVGTQPGAKDLVDSGETQATSYLAGTLPAGKTVYVSVWTRVGGVWNVTSSTLETK